MTLPAVKARFAINVIENSARQILLLKRYPGAKMQAGRWGFPAGHIEANETAAECAERERLEEIGDQHHVRFIKQYGPIRDTFYGGIYELMLFHQQWLGGEVHLNYEHTDYAWVGQQEYENYDIMDGIDEDLVYLNIWQHSE